MAWIVLIVAGLFETAWAVGLKYTEGFTRLVPSILTIVALTISMVLLAWAVRTLPIGTAYAVWVGIGAFGAVMLGVLLFGESMTPQRAGFLLLLLVALVGLRLTSGDASPSPTTHTNEHEETASPGVLHPASSTPEAPPSQR